MGYPHIYGKPTVSWDTPHMFGHPHMFGYPPVYLDAPICLDTPICLDAPICLKDIWMHAVYIQHKKSMFCQTEGVFICPAYIWMPPYVKMPLYVWTPP